MEKRWATGFVIWLLVPRRGELILNGGAEAFFPPGYVVTQYKTTTVETSSGRAKLKPDIR